MSKKIVKSEFEPEVQTPKTVLFLIMSLLERQENVRDVAVWMRMIGWWWCWKFLENFGSIELFHKFYRF